MGDNVTRVGLSAMNGLKGNLSGISGGSYLGDNKVSIARVTYVLLDDSNKEKFDKLGGWKSLGAIECVSFINNNDSTAEPIIAYPIDTNATKFPVENELVLLVNLVSYKAQSSIENYDPRIYYISTIPGFNAVSHNAIPNEAKLKSNEVTGIFKDTVKVAPLLKHPGDITFESRSGSSIRVGSIIEGFNSPFSGKNRTPLLILSNNRRESADSKLPVFEDVDKDGSTVAMLSPNQSINFIPSSNNFKSYGEVIQNSKKNDYVVPKTEKDPIVSSPQTSDQTKIEKAKDTAPSTQEVKSKEAPKDVSNERLDAATLPDNENIEFFVETDNYVFTSDLIQYSEDEKDDDEYDPRAEAVEIKSFSSIPSYIENYGPFKKFINYPGVKSKLEQMSRDLNFSIPDFLVICYAESGFLTKAQNEKTKATGLIQFMPSTAKKLGTNTDALMQMDYLQQLVYVEKYFTPYKNKLKDPYSFYGYTFLPISVGKPLNWVLKTKKVTAEKLSAQNSPIAYAAGKKPGVPLTVADFYKYVNKLLQKRKKQ